MLTQASKPKSEVADYNRIVQLLHEEAFKDALMSKQAKQEKLVKRQERRVMKMQKQQVQATQRSKRRRTTTSYTDQTSDVEFSSPEQPKQDSPDQNAIDNVNKTFMVKRVEIERRTPKFEKKQSLKNLLKVQNALQNECFKTLANNDAVDPAV